MKRESCYKVTVVNLEELISLFAYYIAIISLVLAYCFAQIQDWNKDVTAFEQEWSLSEQRTNSSVKVRQQGRLKALRSEAPHFFVWAPITLALVLLVTATLAYFFSGSCVPGWLFGLLILAPMVLVVVGWLWFTLLQLKKGSERLGQLERQVK